jgi:lactoylglutathione lyase
MLRVKNLDQALDFFINKLGLVETRRNEYPDGKFTLVFLAVKIGEPEIELTYNWNVDEAYSIGRNFGHLAFEVENIYEFCDHLINKGVIINRPPRDGHMAFIKSPDGHSIELLQKGTPLAIISRWKIMENSGSW